MFCSQCAHKLAPSDVYCPKCAKPIASFNFTSDQIPDVEFIGETETVVRLTQKSGTRPSWWYIGAIFGVLAACAIFLGGFAIFVAVFYGGPLRQNQGPTLPDRPGISVKTDKDDSLPTPTVTDKPENPKNLIVNSIFPVHAGNLVSYDFEAKSTGTITGGFRAYGGSKDVDVYIVDEINYVLLNQGNAFRSVFGRPKAERGKIDVVVSPGRYYVVFSNKHALLTGKEVAAEIYFQEQ